MGATLERARQLAVELLAVVDELQAAQATEPRRQRRVKRSDREALLLAAYERAMAARGTPISVPLSPPNLRCVACLQPYSQSEAESLIGEYVALDDPFVRQEGAPLRLLPEKLPKVLMAREAAAARKARLAAAANEVARHERAAEERRAQAPAAARFTGPPPEFTAAIAKIAGKRFGGES